MTEYEPDTDRVQDRAEDRQHERASRTESTLQELDARLADADIKYPVRGEELSTEYGLEMMDLPNETESLGSVFDRLSNEEFATEEAVYDAVAEAIGGSGTGGGEQPVSDTSEASLRDESVPSDGSGGERTQRR